MNPEQPETPEITDEQFEFAEQLTEERIRGQNWLEHAKKVKEEADQEDKEEREAEEAAEKPNDPFDVKPSRPDDTFMDRPKGSKNWLGKLNTEKAQEIMSRKRGRPKGSKNREKKRDRAMKEAIQVMTAAGLKPTVIAKVTKLKLETLQELYPHELEYGEEILTSRMVNALIQKALDGNTNALIFYLKSKAGWKEADKSEPDKDQVQLSEVERTQRLMSILMANPAMLDVMKKRRDAIDVTPTSENLNTKGDGYVETNERLHLGEAGTEEGED
jgi:hypothetical protein